MLIQAQLTNLLWLYSKYILNMIDMTLNLITTFSSNLASCTVCSKYMALLVFPLRHHVLSCGLCSGGSLLLFYFIF